jgi:allantoin racemase
MATRRIALVNPNTDASTTAAMVQIATDALTTGDSIHGFTAANGTALITDEAQLAVAADAVLALAPALKTYDAVIVSAFGDPGCERLAHALAPTPVVGIGEASMAEAARLSGGRFSVASPLIGLSASIERIAEESGVGDAVVSVRSPPKVSAWISAEAHASAVSEIMAQGQLATENLLTECVTRAIKVDGARAVVIGGGPLARAARALAPRFNVPIIEPIPVAVAQAIARLDSSHRSRTLLRVWLLVVAALRMLSVALALAQPDVLAQRVFTAAPEQLTPLGARVFAAWTATSGGLTLLCAWEGPHPTSSTYLATALSFTLVLGLFLPELALHHTMTLASLASPASVALISLVWMARVRWPRKGLTFWVGVWTGLATLLVVCGMGADLLALGFPDRLDALLLWNEPTARALLSQLGPAGRQAYAAMYFTPQGDLVLPMCYAPALAALCRCRSSRRRAAVLVPPLLAGACDLVENWSVIALLRSYPDWSGVPLALRLGPWATLGKWVGLTTTCAGLVVGAVSTPKRKAA